MTDGFDPLDTMIMFEAIVIIFLAILWWWLW